MELIVPYTMIVSGQTGSGKSLLVENLLKSLEETHSEKIEKIILAFSIIQDGYLRLKESLGDKLELVEGFPGDELDKINESKAEVNTLVVLDDLMVELESDKRVATLFTKMRHKRVSTIFIVQNLYFNGKYMRTITRNAHYLIVFENPRDTSMITTLGRQVFPNKPKFLPDAFRQATQKPFGYLLLDFKPGTDKRLRAREGILPHEQTFVYLPR